LEETNCLQKYFFEKIKGLVNEYEDPIIERKNIKRLLGRYKIPSYLHNPFLKEIEKLGYIKIHNRKKFEINREFDFNFESEE